MKHLKPILHARDHMQGGADPLLPEFPTGDTMADKILAAVPWGFWKLNETSGIVAHDSSGSGLDMQTHGVEYAPLWAAQTTPYLEPAADFQTGTSGPSGTAARVSRTWPMISDSFTAGIWVYRNTNAFSMVMGQGFMARGTHDTGWLLQIYGSTAIPELRHHAGVWIGGMGTSDTDDALWSANQVGVGDWFHLAVAFDADIGEVRLYIDGYLESFKGLSTMSGSGDDLWIGHDGGGVSDDIVANFVGSYAFLVDRPMSSAELLPIAGTEPPDDPGGVLGPGGWVKVKDKDVADDANIQPWKLQPGEDDQILTTVDGVAAWADPAAAGGDPAADTSVWMPLYDSDGTVVLDSDGNLIPTLIPLV